MRLLDLFCCQGGCSRGYMDSGLFDSATGVDIKPQPRYPYEFIQGDAMELLRDKGFISQFDFIHASPPCQRYSPLKSMATKGHPALIELTRDLLVESGRPWVMENVVGAPMSDALILCGSMFNLNSKRHRQFETSKGFVFPPCSCSCDAHESVNSRGGYKKEFRPDEGDYLTITGHSFLVSDAKVAMGIDWMSQAGLSQAIPPAYTKHIALQMFADLPQGVRA